jgi:hypothetical protein
MTYSLPPVINLPHKVTGTNRSCREDKHYCQGKWTWSESRIQVVCGCECHNDVEQNKRLYARSVSLLALEKVQVQLTTTGNREREDCDQCDGFE